MTVTMTEEFLDWAIQQEEGLIISAGYDPDASPQGSQDQLHSGSDSERGEESKPISGPCEKLGREPARVSRP